jgi:hypothetical protein
MKSIAKTAFLKQLRAKYPIAIERCNAILEHCKWDLDKAESHLKTALATQFSQKTGSNPTIANEWLEKYDFDVSKAIQHFKSAQQSITAQILWSGSSSSDKVWRIFRAIEESYKSGRHGSTLESNFYEFCESLYYCEHQTPWNLFWYQLNQFLYIFKTNFLFFTTNYLKSGQILD